MFRKFESEAGGQANALVGFRGGLAEDRDRGRHIPVGNEIGAKFLQGDIGVGGLVVRVGINERGSFIEEDFPDDVGKALAAREPVPPADGSGVFQRPSCRER